MRKQGILLMSFAVVVMCGVAHASGANNQSCSIIRSYVDANKILRHFSSEKFPRGSIESSSHCKSGCARYALSVPEVEMQKVIAMRDVRSVKIRCNYGSGERDAPHSNMIAASEYPVNQLRLRRSEPQHNSERRNINRRRVR